MFEIQARSAFSSRIRSIGSDTSTAVTDLHPAGSALINRKRYDVVSQGSYIGKGTGLVVVSVEGNRIVVKEQAHKNEAAVTPER